MNLCTTFLLHGLCRSNARSITHALRGENPQVRRLIGLQIIRLTCRMRSDEICLLGKGPPQEAKIWLGGSGGQGQKSPGILPTILDYAMLIFGDCCRSRSTERETVPTLKRETP